MSNVKTDVKHRRAQDFTDAKHSTLEQLRTLLMKKLDVEEGVVLQRGLPCPVHVKLGLAKLEFLRLGTSDLPSKPQTPAEPTSHIRVQSTSTQLALHFCFDPQKASPNRASWVEGEASRHV